jgi:hypothetical protein
MRLSFCSLSWQQLVLGCHAVTSFPNPSLTATPLASIRSAAILSNAARASSSSAHIPHSTQSSMNLASEPQPIIRLYPSEETPQCQSAMDMPLIVAISNAWQTGRTFLASASSMRVQRKLTTSLASGLHQTPKLERTAPRVTPAAPPPSPAQPSRRAGQSLSLRSFGDATRFP